jgi:hypothetical protein
MPNLLSNDISGLYDYDYRLILNQIFSELTSIHNTLSQFKSVFDDFILQVQAFFDKILSFLPQSLWFIVILLAVILIIKLFFPRWRDV